MRRAHTLAELAVILAILGIICAVAVPRILRDTDRVHVRGAIREVVNALAAARATAVARGQHVAVRFEPVSSTVLVSAGGDTILVRRLDAVHGVRITSNRDSLAYAPTGLGYGAANQTVVLRRGAAVDTVVISRLGRVR
jgi:Tfp pilus assembly protein FimT